MIIYHLIRFVLLLTFINAGIISNINSGINSGINDSGNGSKSTGENTTSDQNTNPVIPRALNFQTDLSDQQLTQRILLLYVSAPDCAFCKKLEKDVLFPLLQSGDYADKIIFRKINWHGDQNIIGFDGKPLKEQDFLNRYNIKATPTLLFLGTNGAQFHQPLLGYRGGEFYWYYFDAAISQSNQNLKNAQPYKQF